jgi:serine/threonine protein phosphatase PrpC
MDPLKEPVGSGMWVAKLTGCTANVVLVTPNYIYTANSGDTRSIICRTNGLTEALSVDHKPEDPIELARIEAVGGYVKEGRICENLNLSRSLGDFQYKQSLDKSYKEQMITCYPDVTVTRRYPSQDDMLVVACDGVWDCLTNEACMKVLQDNITELEQTGPPLKDLEEPIMMMFNQIIAKDIASSDGGIGTDNMTCILIKFKDAVPLLINKKEADQLDKE